MVRVTPNVQQALLQFISVMHPQLIDSLLLVFAPYLIDQIGVGAIWWPQIWSNVGIVARSPTVFSIQFLPDL